MHVMHVCVYVRRSGDSHNIRVKVHIKDEVLLGSKKFSPVVVQSESICILGIFFYIQMQFNATLSPRRGNGGNLLVRLSRLEY